jgi:hypothetical protein
MFHVKQLQHSLKYQMEALKGFGISSLWQRREHHFEGTYSWQESKSSSQREVKNPAAAAGHLPSLRKKKFIVVC